MRALSMIVCIWLSVWAIRKQGEIDEHLDTTSNICRWLLVIGGFACAGISGERMGTVRLVGFILAMLFLCWPNFAYRVTGQKRREDTLEL